ncbi:MAG: hypothetical protein ABIN89_28115 [Chitinophagaceae bacterium]
MTSLTRRRFLAVSFGSLFLTAKKPTSKIMTIDGPISSNQLGTSLIHEHILVDFIGADRINFNRWDKKVVAQKLLPYLLQAKQAGVISFFDCTPNFLGRDVLLLKMLASKSGLQIITNTGYYGAGKNKYLPPWAFTETAEQLSDRWIDEFENGIQGSFVRPGFIKIGVDSDQPLSELHQKLVKAAAITHVKTGLVICSHTGKAKTAFEEIEILQKTGVAPSAFIWVHAQAEKDKSFHSRAAKLGTWVSLDGIGWGDFDNYADSITRLKAEGLLHRVLISHDAGWYKPAEPDAAITGYTNIFRELLPRLEQKGFSKKDIDQLLIKNPAEAMSIRS